jgi:TRAP-type C4-dicarboxylate transport system substrate-binding protein
MFSREFYQKVLKISFAVTVIALLSFSGVSFGKDQIVLKATTIFPVNALWNMNVQPLINMIEEETDGRIKINWLGGPEVIGSFDQTESLRKGIIDLILFDSHGYFKSLAPASMAKGLSECMPWEERKNGAYELWDKIYREKANIKYLGHSGSPILKFSIFSKKKIEKLEDFKNFVCRSMPLYVPFLKALGASPVTMPPPDVYTALQRGVVDGIIWPTFISDFGWHEQVEYMIEPSFFAVEAGVFMNLDKWNQIPEDLQETITNCMEIMEYIGTGNNLRAAQKEYLTQKKAGVKTIVLSPADGEKLRRIAYEETWKEVIKYSPDFGPKLKMLTSPCVK